MNLGEIARKRLNFLTLVAAAMFFSAAPSAAQAQDIVPAVVEPLPALASESAAAEPDAAAEAVAEVEAYEYFGPDMIKGQPVDGNMGFQPQFSPTGEYALWMHDYILMPVITVISLFVLGLLLWVVARYNRRRNPVASKTSHNTFIEVVWTLVPVLILVVIAVPSITLLARQFKSPAEDALTVKVTGYQWYWGYEYPDNGGFEVISNMMPESDAIAAGFPPQLEVDNRMVVPVGEEVRLQITGADVIHSFAVPSLWFKMDAVPGRLNEKTMIINEEGIYYGQCSELCGARHAYMPIAVEAVSRERFDAWVRSKGGTTAADQAAAEAAAEAEEAIAAEAAPAA